jgi:hypothetical protein
MVDWVTAMDLCASQGIVNYDAPAAILGQPPRYFGNPEFEKIPSLTQPSDDVYDTNNGDIVKPQKWKKTLLKTLIGVGALAGVVTLIDKGKLNISKIKGWGKSLIGIFKKSKP